MDWIELVGVVRSVWLCILVRFARKVKCDAGVLFDASSKTR